MTTVIQNWVCDKTGVSLNLEHKDVGGTLFDGLVYYKLIEFITPGRDSVKPPKHPVSSHSEALSNLEMLCPWLKILGVNHSPTFLKDISQCKKEACLRMLYEIYLRVEDKNHIYMVTKQREAYLLAKEENDFKVKKAIDSQVVYVDTKFRESAVLEHPLIENKSLVTKYKYRKEKILKKCKQESARRAQKLILLNFPKLSSNNDTEIDLTSFTSHSEGRCIRRIEPRKQQIGQSPEQMYLFRKKKRILNIEKTKMKMFVSILQDLWRSFLTHEYEDFDNLVRAKLLRQSSQEKQLSIQWLKLHTQYKNFFQHSIVTNEQSEPTTEPILADIFPYKKVDEKKRLLELHDRLFDEVSTTAEKEKYSICRQAVNDLVDYCTLKSEYWRANDLDVPAYVEFLWKELFYKGLPIELEVIGHFDVKSDYKNTGQIKMERLQTKTTEVLLDAVLDCYLKQVGMWSATPRDLDNFGFIIHKLLQYKYPLPPNSQPVKLPDFTIKAIMAGIQDPLVFGQLKTLLEEQSVVLIDVNLFTNHCLEQYGQERVFYEIDSSMKNDITDKYSDMVEMEEFAPRYKTALNKETQFPPLAGGKPKYSYAGLLGKLAFEMLSDGQTLDDVLLVAMLVEYLKTLEGKRGFVLVGYPTTLYQILAFEYFVMGKPLHTNINIPDDEIYRPINSGILLHLNNLIRRCIDKERRKHSEGRISSSIPEHSEGGLSFSIPDYTDESGNEKEYEITEKPDGYNKRRNRRGRSQTRGSDKRSHSQRKSTLNSENVTLDKVTCRNSKIVPNPSSKWPDKESISQTYIERYIVVCKGNSYLNLDRNPRENENKTLKDYKGCKTTSEKTNYLRRDNAPGEQIYEQYDKSTRVYIWDFDVETVAFISKIILDLDIDLPTTEIRQSTVTVDRLINSKEINIPLKPTVGMSEEILYIPSPAYYDCKRLVRRSHVGKTADNEMNSTSCDSINDNPSLYLDKPLPGNLQLTLAFLWEQVEKSYLENVRESMNKLLGIKSQWLPFRNYVRQINENCIQAEDERLQIVNNFQIMFNAVELFTRRDSTVKAELHYRVKELKSILLNLVEMKKSKAEEVKNDLVNTPWVRNYTLLLSNSYLRLLQHEIDRTVDSLQIVVDYYTSLLGMIPDSKALPKVDIKPILFDEEEHVSAKKKSKVSQSVSLKISLSSVLDSSGDRSANFMMSGLNLIRGKIKSLQSFFTTMINSENKNTSFFSSKTSRSPAIIRSAQSMDRNKEGKGGSSKKLTAKRKMPSRGKSINSSGKLLRATASGHEPSRNESRLSTRTKLLKHESSEEQILKAKIKSEWETVVRMELGRLDDIVAIIEEKASTDIETAVDTIKYLYQKFEMDIEQHYQRECEALSNISDIFSAAIEDEVPIQPLLVFENDTFFIDKSNLLYEDTPPDPPVNIEEETDMFKFKISHLEKLAAKLQIISPNAIMIQTLSSVLHSHFQSSEVPRQWKQLSKKELDEILGLVYGRVDVVDWKVFVLFGTDIPFPTVEDLLELKRHFERIDSENHEIISKEQFYNTTLWFDRDFSPDLQGDLHLILSKLLIQKLFEVGYTELNYKEFLLFFCKSGNNKEGFMKILEMLNDKSNLGRKDCAVHEIIPVDAIIVAKQEFDRILTKAFYIIDDVMVKTLPADYYENTFASCHNEYLETEMILVRSSVSRLSISRNYESDTQLEKKIQGFEEYKNCLPLYERFREPIWFKCLHYKLALTILMLALNLNSTSPDCLQRHFYIETRLKDLFKEKGVNNYIQAFHLYESKLMQEIFETSFFFKTCQLDVLLKKYVRSSKLRIQSV